MAISIGAARTFKNPDSWKVKPDARIVRTELYNGYLVQNFGVCGNIITCNAVFTAEQFQIVKAYADNITEVTVIDQKGTVYAGSTIVIDDWNYTDEKNRYKKAGKFISASLAIWTR